MSASFAKEVHAYAQFAFPGLPVPPILHLGRLGELDYAVSKKLSGRILDMMSPEEYDQVLPVLLETLCRIHLVDVRGWTGFGTFDDCGVGMSSLWRSGLAAIHEEEPGGFYGSGTRCLKRLC